MSAFTVAGSQLNGALIPTTQYSLAVFNDTIGTITSNPNGTAIFNYPLTLSNSITIGGTSGTLTINNTTASISTSTGALVVAGGIGANSMNVNSGTIGSLRSTTSTMSSLVITATTVSSSTSTGALIVAGGLGVGGFLNSLNGRAQFYNITTNTQAILNNSTTVVTFNDGNLFNTFGTNLTASSNGSFINNFGTTLSLLITYNLTYQPTPGPVIQIQSQIDSTTFNYGGFCVTSAYTKGILVSLSGTTLMQLAAGAYFRVLTLQESGSTMYLGGFSNTLNSISVYQLP